MKESRGILGWLKIWHLSEDISIRYRDRETTLTVRASDPAVIRDIELHIETLARVRGASQRRYGRASVYYAAPEDEEITRKLKAYGVRLPYWLK